MNWMETIEFKYTFKDPDSGESKEISMCKKNESLTCSEVCEMFMDFMDSVGYCESNIWDYFKE